MIVSHAGSCPYSLMHCASKLSSSMWTFQNVSSTLPDVGLGAFAPAPALARLAVAWPASAAFSSTSAKKANRVYCAILPYWMRRARRRPPLTRRADGRRTRERAHARRAAQTGCAVGRGRAVCNASGAIRWPCTTTPVTKLPPNMFETMMCAFFSGAPFLEIVVRVLARGGRAFN